MIPIASLLRRDDEKGTDGSSAVDYLTSKVATVTGDDQPSEPSGGRLKKALLGLGLLGAAAVLINRRRGLPTSVNELRETASDAADEAETVSVDLGSSDEDQASEESDTEESDTEESDTEESDTEESDTEESGAEESAATGTETDSADEESSSGGDVPEAVEERSVEDAQEEPAEPGEMNVDDDVVEEVTDEEEGGDEGSEEGENEENADQA